MRRGSLSSVRIFYPKFSREELIARIGERLLRLNEKLPLTLVALFGSYAKGNYTAASDVDLLVVYKGEPRDEAYALVKRELNIPLLEPHLYTEAEYEMMQATIEKMIAKGVVLFDAREMRR